MSMRHWVAIALAFAFMFTVFGLGVIMVTTATAAPTTNTTITETTTVEETEVVGQVDADLAVVDYWVDDGAMHIKLRSTGYNLIKLSDYSGRTGQGFEQIPTKTVELTNGDTTTVRMQVDNPQQAVVGIATTDGQASLGKRDKPLFGSSFSTTEVRLVGLSGVAAALTAVLGVVWRRKSARDGPERVR